MFQSAPRLSAEENSELLVHTAGITCFNPLLGSAPRRTRPQPKGRVRWHCFNPLLGSAPRRTDCPHSRMIRLWGFNPLLGSAPRRTHRRRAAVFVDHCRFNPLLGSAPRRTTISISPGVVAE